MSNTSTSQTTLDKDTHTDVPVSIKRKVTYKFLITTTEKLNLPFAVSINGRVNNIFANKAKKVNTLRDTIKVEDVEPGQKVSLYLNSDAHPDYRKSPVYSVTPYDYDIEVTITEKKGKHPDSDTPIKVTASTGSEKDRKIERYSAFLTGDIWMRVSHAYTPAEVDILLSAETDSTIKALIKGIYDGIPKPVIIATLPSTTEKSSTKAIVFNFGEPTNAKNNVCDISNILNECLKRTHPTAFAAAIHAAVDTNASKVSITSTWRPMEGSIAHRAGLGLDINIIDSARLNREELIKASAMNTENVSQKEKELFEILKDKKEKRIQANQNLLKAQAEVQRSKSNPGLLLEAKQNMQKAEELNGTAEKELKAAEIEWNNERDKNEPENIRRFRGSLVKSKYVAQIFDPWFMDDNVKDSVKPAANLQITSNETTHSHHLHITVVDSKIL